MEPGEKRANRINSYHRFERSISFFLVACGEDEPTGAIKRANSFSIFFHRDSVVSRNAIIPDD